MTFYFYYEINNAIKIQVHVNR